MVCPGAKRPCLPWKGRWLSVSETGGVCTSNRVVLETPQSDLSVPKCRQICQLPFQGRPWQNRHSCPFNEPLYPGSVRADAIRPYRASFFIFVWSAAYRSRQWRYIRRKSRTPHTCRIKFPVRSRTDSSSIGLFCGTFAYPPIKKAAGGILRQLLCYSILCRTGRN